MKKKDWWFILTAGLVMGVIRSIISYKYLDADYLVLSFAGVFIVTTPMFLLLVKLYRLFKGEDRNLQNQAEISVDKKVYWSQFGRLTGWSFLAAVSGIVSTFLFLYSASLGFGGLLFLASLMWFLGILFVIWMASSFFIYLSYKNSRDINDIKRGVRSFKYVLLILTTVLLTVDLYVAVRCCTG
ncbi:MAG: hypothetical protein A2931_00375 [Candidatus Niyogibacteria bacterium RIFCSPLOWO2_01_FULL_45_48]|uniref:Uncharacterized protein n=2 Tax=Candidatus Niyogiibacteriota TaxID=1817912 RepID=A0A1G2EZ74_9BACT|nr:MAG: hypothetical protein A2931_00375 [Candidatus Niyogibacteria bacterium RIFCSPLOWO2_01_FULL_45_48]OGZ30613.1 MAG: hypothetical protein A2835_03520 [Candidatus Niyogibacteria bacterium RIFCSPHIGHO2_01_FULL_45_28]OGZ31126.1 MAG: hypothetical protein A3J00_03355 [Candidatus Niyogibacteria bacterium RIFCSPLOWO2_02_FULL_45_13]